MNKNFTRLDVRDMATCYLKMNKGRATTLDHVFDFLFSEREMRQAHLNRLGEYLEKRLSEALNGTYRRDKEEHGRTPRVEEKTLTGVHIGLLLQVVMEDYKFAKRRMSTEYTFTDFVLSEHKHLVSRLKSFFFDEYGSFRDRRISGMDNLLVGFDNGRQVLTIVSDTEKLILQG